MNIVENFSRMVYAAGVCASFVGPMWPSQTAMSACDEVDGRGIFQKARSSLGTDCRWCSRPTYEFNITINNKYIIIMCQVPHFDMFSGYSIYDMLQDIIHCQVCVLWS